MGRSSAEAHSILVKLRNKICCWSFVEPVYQGFPNLSNFLSGLYVHSSGFFRQTHIKIFYLWTKMCPEQIFFSSYWAYFPIIADKDQIFGLSTQIHTSLYPRLPGHTYTFHQKYTIPRNYSSYVLNWPKSTTHYFPVISKKLCLFVLRQQVFYVQHIKIVSSL